LTSLLGQKMPYIMMTAAPTRGVREEKYLMNPTVQVPIPTADAVEKKPNLTLALIGGLLGMLLGAALWTGTAYMSTQEVSWIAIGVGLVVGFGVRLFGRGPSLTFGLIAGGLSLAGCLLGELAHYSIVLARGYHMGFFEVLGKYISNPSLPLAFLKNGIQARDLLFYAVAMGIGFQVAYYRRRRSAPPSA
jgi:hypothetical protein